MIVLSVNAKQNVVFSARANIIFVMMIAFFQFIHKIRKQRTFLLTSDFNSGSGFSVVVAAAADDTDADADDAASGAALVFVVVVVVVVFSAVSASAATLTALTLLDFCLNDVVVLFVPPLRDAVA
jgi:hypothetical protein